MLHVISKYVMKLSVIFHCGECSGKRSESLLDNEVDWVLTEIGV